MYNMERIVKLTKNIYEFFKNVMEKVMLKRAQGMILVIKKTNKQKKKTQ